ncbi:MAG: ATP-dependent RecD-like DNA helicase [Eubacteriales bacterium]|nr:ATP-dependent RecD-like DNA helicase [Eubacteriales bacterium]
MTNIEGMVESIIFRNESNGYTVCEISTSNGIVTLVGCMPFVNEGEILKAAGNWTSHPDYGEQFKVEGYEKVLPRTKDAIERYLASGVIKGIGPSTAKKIVERFGEDSINVIQYNPEKLSVIKGISDSKAEQIGRIFDEQREMMDVVFFLQKFGLGPSYAAKVYKEYGSRSVELIKNNPYRLADEVFGIGFKIADRIAMNLGLDPSSLYRVCSAMKHVLARSAESGHTYLPREQLAEYTENLLNTEACCIEDALESLQLNKAVYIEKEKIHESVYLTPFYVAEQNSAARLSKLCNCEFKDIRTGIEHTIEEVEKEEGIKLAELQLKAVKQAISNGVLVITGGPGTGKTTIIKSLIRIFIKNGLKVELAAPTGRAAKRMAEATGYEARTLHRLLETGFTMEGEGQFFQRTEDNPLEADAVIIDEMSMVDILLFNGLLKALPAGTRLIMVGDSDQLASVGPGNVLKDVILSDVVASVQLTEIFRQSEESKIILNAHMINHGEVPEVTNKDEDFFFIERKNGNQIIQTIMDLCCSRLPSTYGYAPMKDIQVLTPTRKGIVGVNNLNIELQKVLNPAARDKNELQIGGFAFREGDRVMQIRNNYMLRWKKAEYGKELWGDGVFNGDMGFITKIDKEEHMLEVYFDDNRIVEYEFSGLGELEPAFAVTIHKSQGSEFSTVIIPMYPGPPVLLTRNLLYTAITRAREKVVLVGSRQVFQGMIGNVREVLRYSGLKDKLQKLDLKDKH